MIRCADAASPGLPPPASVRVAAHRAHLRDRAAHAAADHRDHLLHGVVPHRARALLRQAGDVPHSGRVVPHRHGPRRGDRSGVPRRDPHARDHFPAVLRLGGKAAARGPAGAIGLCGNARPDRPFCREQGARAASRFARAAGQHAPARIRDARRLQRRAARARARRRGGGIPPYELPGRGLHRARAAQRVHPGRHVARGGAQVHSHRRA